MRKVQSCTKFLVFFYSNTAPRSASHSQSCWTDGYSHGLCCDIGILGPLNKDNTGATEDPANGVSFRGRLGKSMTLKKDPNRTSEEYIVKFEYSIFQIPTKQFCKKLGATKAFGISATKEIWTWWQCRLLG